MRVKTEARYLARQLRREGHSFADIRRVVPVAKSTLNGWLKDIQLTDAQQQVILLKIYDARRRAQQLGAWQNRQRSLTRIRRVIAQAREDLRSRIGDPLFLTGIVLFWAEGSKTTRHFQFTNSDPNAIGTMVAWLTRCVGIAMSQISARIYAHPTYGHEDLVAFWAGASGLQESQFRRSVTKPTRHQVRKNPAYMGCCRLDVFSSELRWKLQGWQLELVNVLGTRALVMRTSECLPAPPS